jgi:hypothetical protein
MMKFEDIESTASLDPFKLMPLWKLLYDQCVRGWSLDSEIPTLSIQFNVEPNDKDLSKTGDNELWLDSLV